MRGGGVNQKAMKKNMLNLQRLNESVDAIRDFNVPKSDTFLISECYAVKTASTSRQFLDQFSPSN
jgi:hypothetical protein